MLISTMSHKIYVDQDEFDIEVMRATPYPNFNSSS